MEKHFENPSEFNILIRKFEDCPQKKSDSGNGYYIVSDVWGTCFHRIATTKDRFEVKWVKNRSYTKIPTKALAHTYHCVVNFIDQAFEIIIPKSSPEWDEKMLIVGIHEPVNHVSADYQTQSFIVYAKLPFEIKPLENDLGGGLWIRTKDDFIRPISLISKYPVHYLKPF